MINFQKLHMGAYVGTTFEGSSVTLTGFRLGAVAVIPPQPHYRPLKSPPRLGLKLLKLQPAFFQP